MEQADPLPAMGARYVAAAVLLGGALMLVVGVAAGERLTLDPSARTLLAGAYLVVISSGRRG